MNIEEILIEFIQWLKTKEIGIIHYPTLTSPTTKGLHSIIEDYLQEKDE